MDEGCTQALALDSFVVEVDRDYPRRYFVEEREHPQWHRSLSTAHMLGVRIQARGEHMIAAPFRIAAIAILLAVGAHGPAQ